MAMYHPLFTRLVASQTSPLLIGLVTFVTTVAAILTRPGAGIA